MTYNRTDKDKVKIINQTYMCLFMPLIKKNNELEIICNSFPGGF